MMQSSVSIAKSLDVFDDIVNNLDLPFHYIKNGCEARAHLMCEHFIAKNIEVKKAWIYPNKDRRPCFLAGRVKNKSFGWNYHVAPVVNVELGGGLIEPMIIDPAMFNGPVSLKKWIKITGVKNIDEQMQITDYDDIPENKYDFRCWPSRSKNRAEALDDVEYYKGKAGVYNVSARKVCVSPLRKLFNSRAHKRNPENAYKCVQKF